MEPQRMVYKRQQQPSTEVAIRSSWLHDLYVVLAGIDDDSRTVTFEVFITPLVFWLWAGGFVMALGTVVAMWPNVRERAAIAAAVRRPSRGSFTGETAAGGD
jgi:cytochrome c-type biogenesis protein CcmF